MVIVLSGVHLEIVRVILKSNERAARIRFEIASLISNQNCTTTKFNYHFITYILKLHNLIAQSEQVFYIINPIMKKKCNSRINRTAFSCNLIGFFKKALKSDCFFF